MRFYKIGFIGVGLLLIVLTLYVAIQALVVLMLSGVIDDGSPPQYSNRICLGQVDFSPDVPVQRHTLQWDAVEQKLLVYHPDWGLLIIDPFKPQERIVAFPRFRGRIVDMTGSLLIVRERTGDINIYSAYLTTPITANLIQNLSTPRLSPDGLQIATRPSSGSDLEYQTILLLTQLDEDEWVIKHEVVFPKAIHKIYGWSETNSLIAVTEWAQAGVHFRIVDATTGKVIKESNNEATLCTGQIIWSHDASTIIYMGSSRGNDNWDLYSERLKSEEVIKLTDTATIDEVSPALSPDQTRLAYVAKYWNEERQPVQQLLMAEFMPFGTLERPLQLTDNPDDFIFNPIWISDDHIIYMVWNGGDATSWEFRMISTETFVSHTIGVFSLARAE